MRDCNCKDPWDCKPEHWKQPDVTCKATKHIPAPPGFAYKLVCQMCGDICPEAYCPRCDEPGLGK